MVKSKHFICINSHRDKKMLNSNHSKHSKRSDLKPEQPLIQSGIEDELLLPPLEFQFHKTFSIDLGIPKHGVYTVTIQYHDSNGTTTGFYEFEMMHLLKNNVKVIIINKRIIEFLFETNSIDGESLTFSHTFIFSNAHESNFELGTPLESIPILLPLDGIHPLCFNLFYCIIPRLNTESCSNFTDIMCNRYEIIIIQSSGSSESDDFIVTQKIMWCTWNSEFPSIRRDPKTGHFFVASKSDDQDKPIDISKYAKKNLVINFPEPVELLENGTLVLHDLSIPFESEKYDFNPVLMMHLSNGIYLFQTPIHPRIQEICIVKSSPPDSWRPRQTTRYFGDGDIIVKKIYLRTGNPLDVLRMGTGNPHDVLSKTFMLGTDEDDEFAGYRLTI